MSVKEYLWGIFLKKVLAGVITGFVASYGPTLSGAGITIEQQALIAAITGLVNGARNYLKVKLNWTWLP